MTQNCISSLHNVLVQQLLCGIKNKKYWTSPSARISYNTLIGRGTREGTTIQLLYEKNIVAHPVVAELRGPLLQVVPLGEPLRNVAPKHLRQLVRPSQVIQLFLLIFFVVVVLSFVSRKYTYVQQSK